jgi:2-dehydro-3-deoxy-D-gluconate 5-dehydrogenase
VRSGSAALTPSARNPDEPLEMEGAGLPKDSGRLFSLADRTIIVTGAGRGLGRAMAVATAREGAHVVGIARSADQLEETQRMVADASGTFEPLAWDLSVVTDLDGLADRIYGRWGSVYGVVHAAGVQRRKPAETVSLDDWRFVQAVNLEAPFFLSTAIGRRQLQAGEVGSHVFVGSLGSSIGLTQIAPYVAAKSGILGVVRALAIEWAQAGIRVNAIAPGYFQTELTADLLSIPEKHDWVLSRIPMRRLGRPSDLDGAVVFLLSEASAYVTGHLLNVDGGWLAG